MFALALTLAAVTQSTAAGHDPIALHPENPRAVRGLETVADRLLASLPDADVATQTEVFGVLQCDTYLRRYPPVGAACRELLGAARCESIAASCATRPTE